MAEYIEKSALVAEIESCIRSLEACLSGKMPIEASLNAVENCKGKLAAYKKTRDIINTLVVIEIGVDFGDPKGDKSALSVIDTQTLEAKEVDLDEEIEKCMKRHHMLAVGRKDFTDIAKTFIELGMQLRNKAQKGGQNMKTGIELIAEERQRQIDVEGYSKQHDSQHNASEFVYAAISYAESAKVGINCMEIGNTNENEIMLRKVEMGKNYPFGWDFKPSTDIRDLVKAGALIAATIDRLQAQKVE